MQGFDLIISKSSQRINKEKKRILLLTCSAEMVMKAMVLLGPAKILITCI